VKIIVAARWERLMSRAEKGEGKGEGPEVVRPTGK